MRLVRKIPQTVSAGQAATEQFVYAEQLGARRGGAGSALDEAAPSDRADGLPKRFS